MGANSHKIFTKDRLQTKLNHLAVIPFIPLKALLTLWGALITGKSMHESFKDQRTCIESLVNSINLNLDTLKNLPCPSSTNEKASLPDVAKLRAAVSFLKQAVEGSTSLHKDSKADVTAKIKGASHLALSELFTQCNSNTLKDGEDWLKADSEDINTLTLREAKALLNAIGLKTSQHDPILNIQIHIKFPTVSTFMAELAKNPVHSEKLGNAYEAMKTAVNTDTSNAISTQKKDFLVWCEKNKAYAETTFVKSSSTSE